MHGLFLFLLLIVSAQAAATGFPDDFSRPQGGLTDEQRHQFEKGRAVFNRDWVPYPGFRPDFDGLGPLFNRASCSGCHFANGRGRPPLKAGETFISMVLRLRWKAEEHPRYGRQVNDRALPGVMAEGAPMISYRDIVGHYADGTGYRLSAPRYSVAEPAYGPLGETVISARVAPHIAGVGLLATVPEATILALADPMDEDGDGISGRVNWVTGATGRRIGRFGWKAEEPTIRSQTVSALHDDIGITSAERPQQNCQPSQDDCLGQPEDEGPEILPGDLEDLVAYQRALEPPKPVEMSERGRDLFAQLRCVACHQPSLAVANGGSIGAYTDLLLHDMGAGLADQGADDLSREWRTPPLWGIGRLQKVNGHTRLLHDGRARNVEEAILWHGGEAKAARDAFMQMPEEERRALIDFVEGL